MPDQLLIFVIDDNDAVRDSLKALLESHGRQVATFASARAFLDAFDSDRRGRRPARFCLLLDLDMPVMDGMALLKLLRASGATLPVVMITGRGDDRTRAQALAAGADAFLEKPLAEDALLAAIAAATGAAGDEPGRGPRPERGAVASRWRSG
jgi:two-component system response regulator FixJ